MNVEIERFDPADQSGRIAYEHLHRYALCREFVLGKRVLDLACGTGYGTAILGSQAAEVTGIDISSSAIRSARRRFGSKNVKFTIGDCYDLPFEDGSFDIVVANEMIEHVEEHDALLAEVRRVLAKHGTLLVSTPNKPVYNRYKSPNPFHVAEMEIPEFRALLGRHFHNVHMIGTRMALLSVSFKLEQADDRTRGNLDAARIHLGRAAGDDRSEVVSGEFEMKDPEYVLAICSEEPIEEQLPASSVFFDEREDLWLEHEKVMAWASGLHEEDEVLRANLARSQEELQEVRTASERHQAERQDLADRLAETHAAQANLAGALESEREVLARETEAVRRENTARLATFAHLLGRIGSNEVAANETAILGSLFDINETLVVEKFQRQNAEARAEQSERDLAGVKAEASLLRSQQEGLVAELDALKEKLADEGRAKEAIESELTEERRAKSELEATRSVLAEEVERLDALQKAALADLQRERADSQRRIADLIRQTEELSAEAKETVQSAHAAAPALAGATSGTDSAQSSIKPNPGPWPDDAIGELHRKTATFISLANDRITGKIAPPPETPRLPLHKRILGKRPTLPTRIFMDYWLARQGSEFSGMTLRAYLADPACRAVSPHPLFDAEWYLNTYPDVAASDINPLAHYVIHGWREGRDPHALFTNDWYLTKNPDVAAAGDVNPLDHYLQHGWREGRWPNPLFNPRSYLDRYPDVEAGEFEPLSHFIAHGQDEDRELSLNGWNDRLPDIAAQGGALAVMARFLRDDPPAAQTRQDVAKADVGGSLWPPTTVDDFWPAQTMREMIQDRYGEPLLGRIWYLLSLMNRWQDRQEEFAASNDCRGLLARLHERANAGVPGDDAVPAATVVIPVYNNVLDTLLCLASLLELDENHDFEVIVADDGSSDATAALITTIGGKVRYVRQPRNLGFLGNCNAAAVHARGRNIVFLNNDTLVFTGWLDGLIDPIDSIPGVGLVGSKLINWDGTLQEAGGIFWRDGSAWNFGRNQDVQAPEFNYLKDVDYCSGASIAVPTTVWREVGGFDPAYAPAYCEDSDLAFRLREAGYRTLYSPASEVVHHEGRSHGRDVSSGIKSFQVVNQQRLVDRWQHVLERDHYPNAENVMRARDRSFDRKHVLIVDHYVPQWDKDAGSRTMFDFMQVLIEAGYVVTLWPDNLWRDPDYTPRLQAIGVEVIFGTKYRDGFEEFLIDRNGLYDMVLLSRPHIAIKYIDAVERRSDARIVYYGHDLHFERKKAERRLAGLPTEDAEVLAIKAQELDICNRSHLVLYPSADEAELIGQLVRPDVDVQAIAAYRYLPADLLDSKERLLAQTGDKDGIHLLFVGGFGHPPNGDAAVWFCEEVMPLLRAQNPDVRLSIAGSRPTPEVIQLQREGIDVLGFVSDERLRELYRDADVVVAPLRYGAGVKGKVIEAMARGRPTVTTRVGAQGIADAAELLFLGDTPEELAAQVLLAAQPGASEKRALRALGFVERHYSTQAMTQILEKGLCPDPDRDTS